MKIDDLLFKLYRLSFSAYDDDKCRNPAWGYQNLEWYITTGRASSEFQKAIENLSDHRMITLIQKCSSSCTDDGVNEAKRYLKLA